MSSNHHQGQGATEKARALLAVFRLQPPSDFAAQVLARVQERQDEAFSHPTAPVAPPTSRRSSPRFWQTYGHTWHGAWWPRVALVSGLLMATALPRWFTCTPPPAALRTDKSAETLPPSTVSADADEPGRLPPASLQPTAPLGASQPPGQGEASPLVSQAGEWSDPPAASAAPLMIPNQVAGQSEPPSLYADQPQSVRHKGKHALRRLRPPKA